MTGIVAALPAFDQSPGDNRWEKSIAEFEAADRQKPPPKGATLFVGSSSIRLWDLSASFPGRQVINRGFGGSQLSDSLHFAERIILPYRPATVVVYAGDNDLAAGKSPEQVAADFRALAARVLAALPQSRILFLSIKPSPKRWTIVEQGRKANRLIQEQIATDERLVYVDVSTPLLGDDQKSRPELFRADQLHLNDAGYRLWTKAVQAALDRLPARDSQ